MRILFVTPSTPFDQSFGAGQRSGHLYKALQQHGEVDVLILQEGDSFSEKPGNFPGELARLTFAPSAWHAKYKPSPQVRKWIGDHLESTHYDLIVGRTLTPISKLGIISSAPTIVDLDDAYYRYVPHRESFVGLAVSLAKTALRTFSTKRAIGRFDYVWFTSESDKRQFPVRAGGVLPNIFPGTLPETLPASRESHSILFVGALWYGPNRHAADWFISKCWPEIVKQVPSAKLRLVGACAVSERERWNKTSGVESVGFVTDLAAEYRAANFTVSPIRYGGGTQIKVLESLVHGRAAIVSDFIYKRYSGAFESGVSLIVAESPEETIEQCVALLREPARAERLAMAGRELVANKFSWLVFHDEVCSCIDKIQKR
jgi:glycosyltransferase involved in cell wall biosynthesis